MYKIAFTRVSSVKISPESEIKPNREAQAHLAH
jgi:hypothetical protein